VTSSAEAETSVDPRPARATKIGEYVFGSLIVALGVFTLIDATTIEVPGSANTVGPRAFPYVVGALLIATGIAVIVATTRGRLGEAEQGEDVDQQAKTDWFTVAKLVAFVGAHMVLIEPAGWPVAAAVLFAGSAWSLGARPWWKAVLAAVVMAVVVQIVFVAGLGLSLPAGVLEGVPLLDG
jgi:putative tricarboxylic transport membrane protein